jgi:hypothetical protein
VLLLLLLLLLLSGSIRSPRRSKLARCCSATS